MIEAPVGKRVRPRWVEILVIAVIAVTVVGLIVLFVEHSREVKKRLECADNLREIGVAMDRFEIANGGFPSDKNPNFPGQSFYQQLVGDLGISDRLADGRVNPNAVVRPFICPGRRKAEDVPGACDYGYVETSGTSCLSVLDASTQISTITCNGVGHFQNTAVLSHIWIAPDKYKVADPRWASRTGYSVSFGKATKAYRDTDPAGAGCLGSPHLNGMPTLFADGHVGILLHSYPQFQVLWDYSNTTVHRHNVP